jgi:hypothetical protein
MIRATVCAMLWLPSIGAECSERRFAKKKTNRMNPENSCRLNITAQAIDASALHLSYEFRNPTESEAWLFNRLYRDLDQQGRYSVDPNLVYVRIENGQVVLSKRIIPVPDEIDVEKPILPCVTRVMPGGHFAESMRIELPLSVWSPYSSDVHPAETVVDMVALFEIGYFLGTSQTKDLAATVPTTQGPAFYFAAFDSSSQKIARTGPLQGKVPVRAAIGAPH